MLKHASELRHIHKLWSHVIFRITANGMAAEGVVATRAIHRTVAVAMEAKVAILEVMEASGTSHLSSMEVNGETSS